jgi:antitoxin component YwqK of YwqJK toxin-antitoxin module
MKHKKYLLPVVLVYLLAACSNEPKVTVNTIKQVIPANTGNDVQRSFVDANGKKQGYWIYTATYLKVPGYAENVKVLEGCYKDGKHQGTWVVYYPDGKIEGKIEYKDDILVKVVASFPEENIQAKKKM